MVVISLLPNSAQHHISQPQTSAKAAFLYEPEYGTVLYSKNEELPLPMASTTKIMTALISIERLDLDRVIDIPKEAVGIEGSSVYLSANDKVRAIDLVYSVLLQSANDAAAALAIEVAGSIDGFADLMNKRAVEIGALNTSFKNPHGLDDSEHYTTAKDLALITGTALKNSTFKKICGTYKYSFPISDCTRTVVNHNKLLRSYDGAIGVKTGYTTKSGRCLVSAAERNGITLIAVTLHAPDDWRDHKNMLDYGFNRLSIIEPDKLSKTRFEVPVIGGRSDYVIAELDYKSLKPLIYEADEEPPVARIIMKKYLVAPIEENYEIGEIVYSTKGRVIARGKILTADKVDCERNNRFNIKDLFKRSN